MRSTGPALLVLLSASALCACSQSSPSAESTGPAPVASGTVPAAAAAADTQAVPKTACELVTAEEMSAILGSAVNATPDESSSGKTGCDYQAVSGISPYVEFSVEWGEGELAMKSAGAMNQHEPGIADPYAGIGDQAVAVGTSLMIRRGADLITIVFSGVTDAPAAARKIYDTAEARLQST